MNTATNLLDIQTKLIQIKTKQKAKMTYFICKFEEYMTWEGSRD
jgi:hypothetical protein